MNSQSPNFYSRDLAHIHANGFASVWDTAIPWLAEHAEPDDGDAYAIDVGCGDGRVLSMLAALGIPGEGFEVSHAFVEAAQANGIKVEQANAADLDLPQASLVLALGEVLSYTDHAGRTALANIVFSAAANLKPGGRLIFDVIGPNVSDVSGWREGRDWLVTSRTTVEGDQLRREIQTFRKAGRNWSREHEVHYQRVSTVKSVSDLLSKAGFKWQAVDAFGETPLLPGRLGFVAQI